MRTLLPVVQMIRRRLTAKPPRGLSEVAAREWQIAPGERTMAPPAYFLPNQLERVTDWVFTTEDPRRTMLGGTERIHRPTRGYLVKGAYLIDGVLYKGDACSYLQPRASRWPLLRAEREVQKGAVYCTAGGNKYFGQWLMDDCVTYPLAAAAGTPVTTDQAVWDHTPGYEDWLDMTPCRLHAAFFHELMIFDDVGQNRSKHERFRALGKKLLARVEARSQSHPGVFIIRGKTGEQRVLQNEMDLAHHLQETRGFRILDPATVDVPTMVKICAGARTIVGVEGSGLMHGILLLGPGGAVLTLQPPNRFCSVYKDMTDRDGQHFGFVVGSMREGGLWIDPAEVERTLDLFP